MGTTIPRPEEPFDPGPAGTLCPECWGIGKPFGDGPTPGRLRFNISGVEKAPGWAPINGEPPEGDFDWDQQVLIPCRYLPDGGFGIERFIFDEAATFIQVFSSEDFVAFFGIYDPGCILTFENQLEDPFINGTLTLLNVMT